MAVLYVTDGGWGTGVHRLLQPAEIDGNFYQVAQDILAKAVQGVGIDHFAVVGNELYVYLTDSTVRGPYPLPVATIQFVGTWLPHTQYKANDIFTYNGNTYIVLINHTSAATFNAFDNDGHGNDFYGLLLSNPTMAIPHGGAPGAFLRKASGLDYDMYWGGAALTDLSNVASTPPANGNVLTYSSGLWHPAAPTGATGGGGSIVTGSPLEQGQAVVYDGVRFTNSSKVDFPAPAPVNVSGSITIDRNNGEVQRLNVVGNITSMGITHWPPPGQVGRLILEILNDGSYNVTLPDVALWPARNVPNVTLGGWDVYGFLSFDAGGTVYGAIIGQDFN